MLSDDEFSNRVACAMAEAGYPISLAPNLSGYRLATDRPITIGELHAMCKAYALADTEQTWNWETPEEFVEVWKSLNPAAVIK